jgi:serine phosphatase RsbU (regulator of sigma subunit)/CRP-like cAMP-binding protein
MNTEVKTALAPWGPTSGELPIVSGQAETRAFPGEVVIGKEGDPCGTLYIVLEGQINAFSVQPSGTEVLYALSAGECFGCLGFEEVSLPATFVTAEPSRLLVLQATDLNALLHKNSVFALRIFEKLLRQLDKQARELSEGVKQRAAISEILRAISSSPSNLQSALNSIAENAARLCDVANSEIFQVEGEELRLVGKYGLYRIWPIGFSIRISRDLVIGRAVLDRTLVQVDDLQEAADDFPFGAAIAKQYGHRTVCALPLLREGSAIGVVLIRRLEVRPLTVKQVALLNTFADQAAIAIENMRLFQEIRQKRSQVEAQAKELAQWNAMLETRVAEQVAQLERLSKLEYELSLASEIQVSMLPRSVPWLEGFEFGARMIPAKSVGGDFFDFIPLGKDSLGIAVGDVSDKGIPAALFMAMVCSLLRAEAHRDLSPAEVLRRVNAHLIGMNDKSMFVTIIFGILNRITRRFQYARAGHETPIFCDGQGTMQRLPKGHGHALGVFDGINLEERTVTLTKGGMMLLYSDGIIEATNRNHESFGFDRIVSALQDSKFISAQSVCDGLMRAVSEHQGDSFQHDDMTAVVIRVI